MKNSKVILGALIGMGVIGVGMLAATGRLSGRSSAPAPAAALTPKATPEAAEPASSGPMNAEAARALVAAARAGRAPKTLVEAALPSGAGLAPERRAAFLAAQADGARMLADAYRQQERELASALGEAPAHDAMPVDVLRARIADSEALAEAHAIVAGLYESAAHP